MSPVVLDVACLCAAWCRTCEDYAGTFDRLQQALPGHRYRWIDIEDEADLLGDLDIETFPTLLIAHAGRVLFMGPVLPRLQDAVRLVETQVDGASASGPGAAAMGGWPPSQQAAAEALAHLLMQGVGP